MLGNKYDLPPADLARLERQRVCALPARWLARLPAAATLGCLHRELEERLLVTTSREQWGKAKGARVAVLHGEHWARLTRAAAHGQAALAVEQWLTTRRPGLVRAAWLVGESLEDLLGPDEGVAAREHYISIGQVLEHFGLTLVQLDPNIPSATEAF